MKKQCLIVICFILTTARLSFAADMDKLDVMGFTLGMTMDAAKKTQHLLITEEFKGNIIASYKAKTSTISAHFSFDDYNNKLYYLSYDLTLKDRLNVNQLLQKAVDKYGEPYCQWKDGMAIVAVWGDNCKIATCDGPISETLCKRSLKVRIVESQMTFTLLDWDLFLKVGKSAQERYDKNEIKKLPF